MGKYDGYVPDKGDMMKYCVIIPALNAGKRMPILIERVARTTALEDIFVIDDGSRDNTAEAARESGANVIVHKSNMGKGAALKTAFKTAVEAKYSAIITIDADLQHPPEFIPNLISTLEDGADMVVGNRMRNLSTMPIERRISNFLSTLATSILAGRKLLDSQCGFRAIKTWILKKAVLYCSKYQLESELLIEAARMGAKIEFFDIPTIYNGNKSYFNPVFDTARFLTFLVTYHPRRWFGSKRNGEL